MPQQETLTGPARPLDNWGPHGCGHIASSAQPGRAAGRLLRTRAGGLFGGTSVGAGCHPVHMASLPGTAPAKAPGQSCDITPVTRRDIFDLLRAEEGPWWGRLDET